MRGPVRRRHFPTAGFWLLGVFALLACWQAAAEPDAAPLTLDLPAPATGSAPAEQEGVVPGQPAPTVRVRGGDHAGYSRIVFDWPAVVAYRIARGGDGIVVRFDAAANADLRPVRSVAPRLVRGITQSSAGGPLEVDIALPAGAGWRDFYVDSRIVIDIVEGDTAAASSARISPAGAQGPDEVPASSGTTEAPAAAQPTEEAARPPLSLGPEAAEVTVEDAADAGPPPAAAAAPMPLTPALPTATAPPRPPDPAEVAAASGGSASVADGSVTEATVVEPSVMAPGIAAVAVAEDPAAEDPADDMPIAVAAPTPGPVESSPRPAPTEVGAHAAGRSASIAEQPAAAGEAAASASEVRVVFDPGVPTRAAVFRRGPSVWVVFAGARPLDAHALAQQGAKALGRAAIVPGDGGLALRFHAPSPAYPMALREGTAWLVALTDRPPTLVWPLTVKAQPDFALGARLLIDAADGDDPIRLPDPDVGDSLFVVPLPEGGTGLPQTRRFAQFSLLASGQGVVLEAHADDVVVQADQDRVTVSAPGGLMLSELAEGEREAPSSLGVRRLFDLESWAGDRTGFLERRQGLQMAIARADQQDRARARFELARFYFASGYAEESLAVLTILHDGAPEAADDRDFIALRGAARVWADAPQAAMQDLQRAVLANEPEAALWRGLAAARGGDWPTADREFTQADAILGDYPSPFGEAMALAAAEAALRRGDLRTAEVRLASIVADDDAALSPGVAYLRGELARAAGDTEMAAHAWERAAGSDDRLYRALAEMAFVDMALEEGELSTTEAAERLESLRFAWRGDALEFRLLQRLGELRWRDGRHRDALHVWARAIERFPDLQAAQALDDMRRSRFAQLFSTSEAEALAPITAISLFDDYRELTPPGLVGDRLMQRLAERLIGMDLLDRAAGLLEDLMDNRLTGEEKSRAGARLAGLRLLDEDPNEALSALDASGGLTRADPLLFERRLLRAQALSELGRSEEALAVLAHDRSALADSARLAIAWRARAWPAIAETLAAMIDPPPPLGDPVVAEQAELLVDYAIALSMVDDRAALDRLAIAYGPAMAATSDANAFAVLTRTGAAATAVADLAEARRRVAEVSQFEAFLADYGTAGREPALTN